MDNTERTNSVLNALEKNPAVGKYIRNITVGVTSNTRPQRRLRFFMQHLPADSIRCITFDESSYLSTASITAYLQFLKNSNNIEKAVIPKRYGTTQQDAVAHSRIHFSFEFDRRKLRKLLIMTDNANHILQNFLQDGEEIIEVEAWGMGYPTLQDSFVEVLISQIDNIRAMRFSFLNLGGTASRRLFSEQEPGQLTELHIWDCKHAELVLQSRNFVQKLKTLVLQDFTDSCISFSQLMTHLEHINNLERLNLQHGLKNEQGERD